MALLLDIQECGATKEITSMKKENSGPELCFSTPTISQAIGGVKRISYKVRKA